MGDLNGAGDVGESEYGEKADIKERSGEGSIGDFNAIIIAETQCDHDKSEGLSGQSIVGREVEVQSKEAAEVNR